MDSEGTKKKEKTNSVYSTAIFLIIATEFCERFSFCGLRTILSLYLRDVLMYHECSATVIYHVFIMVCYFVTVLGAIIADSYLGRFRTILYFSLIYASGNIMLSAGAIPPLCLPATLMTIIGLCLIAGGTGGIKPCVAAFGGDQFKMPKEQEDLKHFFSIFYFMINFGGFAGMLTTPILRKAVHCFGDESCYALGFGLPAGLMIVALVLFLAGKSWYRIKSPKEKIMVQFIKCAGYAVLTKLTRRRSCPKKGHWLDYAEDKYNPKLIQDMKTVLAILFLFMPLPLFWSLFDQQGSRWTFQASRTNTKLFGVNMIPDQMQIINPVIVLILIPVFEKSLYPWWDRMGILNTPLQKMVIGGFIASLSFIAAGLVELRLEATYPVLPGCEEAHIHVINTLPCDIELANSSDQIQPVGSNNHLLIKNIQVMLNESDYQMTIIAPCKCGPVYIEEPIRRGSIQLHRQEVSTCIIIATQSNQIDVYKIPFEDLQKSRSGRPKLRLVIVSEDSNLVEVTLKGKRQKTKPKTILNSDAPVHISCHFELDAGKYSYDVRNTRSGNNLLSGNISLDVGGVYCLIIKQNYNQQTMESNLLTMTLPNSVHLLWLVPQYLLISIGEVMFAIAGLQFTFTQAPKSMKTITIAAWYLTVALGNLIVIIVAKLSPFGSQAIEFFFFASLVFLDNLVFIILVTKYKTVCLEADDSTTVFNLQNGKRDQNFKETNVE